MRHLFKRRSVLLFCALLVSSIIVPKLSANLTGNWRYHASAALSSEYVTSSVYRILDGNKYVYFLVRGGTYRTNNANSYAVTRKIDPIQVFRYDKSTEWKPENIKQLANEETSGYVASIAEYSPRLGLFVVIYDNNNMDLVYDDGRVIKSTALSEITSPLKQTVPYSITFDTDEDAYYLASSRGYQKIDAKTGENLQFVPLDKKITWACRVGDKMILFGGDNIDVNNYSTLTYCFGVNEQPKTLSGYELKLSEQISGANMNSDGTLNNLQGLMPVGNSSFVAFPVLSEQEASLIKIDLSDTGNTGKVLVTKCSFDGASSKTYRHLFTAEGRYGSTKDGYMISDNSNIYLISGLNGTFDFQTINKTGFDDTSETAAKISSVDGKKFWLHGNKGYNPFRGFYSRSFDNGWSAKTDVIWPNSPVCMIAPYIDWNPKYGMLFRGPGTFFTEAKHETDFFYSYKDGKWSENSYFKHSTPYNYIFPTACMNFVETDPINPDFVWGAVWDTGLVRMDLDDYTNFFAYGSEERTDYPAKYPGYFNVIRKQPLYPIYCSFSNVSFDKDKTMWFVYRDLYDFDSDGEAYTDQNLALMYLTAEERESMSHIGTDESKVIMPHEITIPHADASTGNQVIALKGMGNANYIAHSTRTYIHHWHSCLIYDHNGTLEDTGDDRWVMLEDLRDDEGNPFTYDLETTIYEDTYSGDLWIGTQKGIIIVNPTKALEGDKTVRRLKVEKRPSGEGNPYPLEATYVYGIKDDNAGRKWIASEAGLICLSRDSKELLGHYTVENSGIPSNLVYGVGCDMETGSIFVSTDQGIAEFQPEDTFTGKINETSLTIWPLTVGPNYNGHINITGADPTGNYVVIDSDNNVVKTLGKPVSGVIQWDITGNDGNPVANGRYDIRRSGTTESHRVNILR